MKRLYEGVYGEKITLNKGDGSGYIVICVEDDEKNFAEICIPITDAINIANGLLDYCK